MGASNAIEGIETGATLTKGTVVYINGGHGNLPTVTKALATSDATSAQTFGIVQTNITNNNNGHVVVIGNLTDLDTQAYAEGTQLYLSSTTAGAYTSVKQYAPAHLVYVAIVVRSHPTQGIIQVKIQNGFEMDELHNVYAQSPANGGILQYVTSTGLWTAVAGTTTNIAEGTNLYYTDTRARASNSFAAGSGAYNSTTGVITIPTNNNQITNGAGYITSSALTGYVPYTGATTDLNLGAFSLVASYISSSGDLAVTGLIGASLGLEFVKGNIPSSFTVGGVTLYSEASSNNIIFRDNSSKAKLIFNNSTQTFTFPALTGTIALLEGSQTFSGSKIFSANPSINTGGQSSLSILSSTGNSALILAYVNSVLKGTIDISATEFKFVSGINSTFKFQASGLGLASLIFDNTTNYSYTFPSATGTIALVGGSGVGTVTSVAMTVPTGLSVSGSPITSSGTLAVTLTAGYSIPTTASQTNWDSAYTNRITSLTTTGSSGAATLISNVLNIPTYTLAGLGGVASNGAITGATKTKITYDAKGLVTSGADATTADIADSTNKRYVTDANLVTIGNQSGTNTGDQNIFQTIAVAGQSNVVADTTSDTLTLVAGTNVTITTNATTDTITISATGGGGGGATNLSLDDIAVPDGPVTILNDNGTGVTLPNADGTGSGGTGMMTGTQALKLAGINTASFQPTGGSTGQVLTKISGSNFDSTWSTPTTGVSEALAIAYAIAL